jgi:O-antigen/teichoic acid export membrane protein
MRDKILGSGSLRRVAYGSITAFAVYVVGVGLTYCSQLFIARVVGADIYGVYAYVFAWITVLGYFCALGFDVALLRFVPAYRARQAWALLRGVIQYAERRAMVVAMGVVLIGLSIIISQPRGFSHELRNTFLVGFILVPVWALLLIRCSTVRAFGGVVSALAPDRLVRDGMLLGLVALASMGLRWKINAPLVMTATLVSSTVGLGLASVAKRQLHPCAIDDSLPDYDVLAWRRTIVPLVLIGAAEALMNRTGVLTLGWIAQTKEAGIYGLAFNIAFVVAVPRIAINTLFAPTISDLYTRKDRTGLQVLVTTAASWTLGGAACIGFALSIVADPLLSWFGHDYESGVPALRILLVGQVIAAAAGSQLHIMTMTGHERGAAVLLLSSTIGNAVASAALVRTLGLTGAAIATTATLILWNVAMGLFIRKHLRLLPGLLAMVPAGRRGKERSPTRRENASS